MKNIDHINLSLNFLYSLSFFLKFFAERDAAGRVVLMVGSMRTCIPLFPATTPSGACAVALNVNTCCGPYFSIVRCNRDHNVITVSFCRNLLATWLYHRVEDGKSSDTSYDNV